NKKIDASVSLLLLVVLAVVAVKFVLYHVNLMLFPFPIVYREGAMIVPTDYLLKGGNPFSLASQPEHTNVYGIMYSLVVYPIAYFFGAGIVVHRIVSGFFVLCSCILVFYAMQRKNGPVFFSFAGMLIFYIHLLTPGTCPLEAGPHSLGLFLFLCVVLVPFFLKYSYPSLFSSLLFGMFAFYSKAYFILSVVYLGVYLFLFVSKKKALIYFVLSVFLSVVSVLVVNSIFDVYFANCFFNHMTVAGKNFESMIRQFKTYFHETQGVVILFGLLLLLSFVNMFRGNISKGHGFLDKLKKYFSVFNFFDINKPLIRVDFDLNLFCVLSSSILLYSWLGLHDAQWMAYFYQLLTPFLLIFVFTKFSRKKWLVVLSVILVCFNIFKLNARSCINRDLDRTPWEQISTIISKYKNVLHHPMTDTIILEQDKKLYFSGQTEYFQYGAIRQGFWAGKGPGQKIVHVHEGMHIAHVVPMIEKYENFINVVLAKQIVNKEFDLILLRKDDNPKYFTVPVQEFYDYKGSIALPLHNADTIDITFWRPKR
ncbi:hypothetical protein KAH94_00800, partial [bacterium]|nr:hypothetical protein [bacterium]